jgi:hypothetical protein
MAQRCCPCERHRHSGPTTSAACSTVEGNVRTRDQQTAKPELIVKVATDVWG